MTMILTIMTITTMTIETITTITMIMLNVIMKKMAIYIALVMHKRGKRI